MVDCGLQKMTLMIKYIPVSFLYCFAVINLQP